MTPVMSLVCLACAVSAGSTPQSNTKAKATTAQESMNDGKLPEAMEALLLKTKQQVAMSDSKFDGKVYDHAPTEQCF